MGLDEKVLKSVLTKIVKGLKDGEALGLKSTLEKLRKMDRYAGMDLEKEKAKIKEVLLKVAEEESSSETSSSSSSSEGSRGGKAPSGSDEEDAVYSPSEESSSDSSDSDENNEDEEGDAEPAKKKKKTETVEDTLKMLQREGITPLDKLPPRRGRLNAEAYIAKVTGNKQVENETADVVADSDNSEDEAF
eukprot:TRINITY_DN8809_c0_g1_i1.p1 TRINITY_DN8809_c0_g1~~TRINITY_DN8809_c0_g1_i1.p1  ORF type:complete len:190 (+),score=53.58 TRINITY_DN8809_c0_g1_i1:61-630(+)